MEILLPRIKYTHEIVGTHGGALLPERAPGALHREQNTSCVSAFKPADKRKFTPCSQGFTDGVAFDLVDPTQYEVST